MNLLPRSSSSPDARVVRTITEFLQEITSMQDDSRVMPDEKRAHIHRDD